MKRHWLLWVWVLLLAGCKQPSRPPELALVPDAGQTVSLRSVGPRLISNQTSQPLAVVGEGLTSGMLLQLGPPVSKTFPLVAVDPEHAFTRLPGGLELGAAPEVLVEASIALIPGRASLRFVNDTAFPELTALVRSQNDSFVFAMSRTTDTIFRVDLRSKQVTAIAVGDGPSALATWVDGAGEEWLVVVHQFSGLLLLLQVKDPAVRRSLSAPSNAAGLVVHQGRAYVAEQARDTVLAIDLSSGRELWRTRVAANPKELQVAAQALLVGSMGTGALEMLKLDTGALVSALEPGPGTPIVGGGTARYSQAVMKGTAVRSLAWSPRLGLAFVASIGPDVGPNPDKMEVSMNGGVGMVDPTKGWRRHVGFGAGVTQALALDDSRGLLYAADVGLGVVRVLDARKLASDERSASKAVLQEIALNVPTNFPRIRPGADFEVEGRAGPSLHAGPFALALSANGARLFVLERFTATVSVLDVRRPGHARWVEQIPLTNSLTQPTRRLGQVLFHADLGKTAMSCDACHPDGHTEGVLFEKTMPLRIYRSPSLRGSRETPPYFTPASTHSMGETAKVVGGRNRFHNPDPSDTEIEALTVYTSLLSTLPNPFVGLDGAPTESLQLPDGRVGGPRRGMLLFEGKAGCAQCHPAPLFTTDQDSATRGRFIDVGTPRFMPLRAQMQNIRFEGFGTPSLQGSWDVFPMLTTGLAGLEVRADGAVRVDAPFALRVAVEKWAPQHGRADLLTETERDDLLAYVMSL